MRVFHIIRWILLGIVGFAAIGLILGVGVQLLWNWLMPPIFGLPEITFWQAIGLFILVHILIGGHHAHHSHPGEKPGWSRFREKLHSKLRYREVDTADLESSVVSD